MDMKKIIRNLVVCGVLLLPFIYSFFYLRAYWDPYGKGNIDNLDIAIVNADEGDKGKELIDSIKDTNKLKLNIVSKEEADDGLNNGKYYAIISIPSDFTSSMESVKTTDKHHATITYSPNQKTNYLSSQIINSVVNSVEEALDNEINSNIVSSLTDTIEEVPNKLDEISDGFSKLEDGTKELNNGSNSLVNGTSSLSSNYNKFNDGVGSIKDGSEALKDGASKLNDGINTLNDSIKGFNELSSGINTLSDGSNTLKNGSDTLKDGSDKFTSSLDNYTNSVNLVLNKLSNISTLCSSNNIEEITACSSVINLLNQPLNNIVLLYENYPNHNNIDDNTYYLAKNMIMSNSSYADVSLIQILQGSSTALVNGNKDLNSGINNLNTGLNDLNNGISSLKSVDGKIKTLQNGVSTLKDGSQNLLNGVNSLNGGINTLYNSSLQIRNGVNSLNGGAFRLNNGLYTLNSSVSTAKNNLDSNISTTKDDVKKVDKLAEYSKNPVKVKRKEVNKISSYGSAFSPFFISIGLWVGSLMSFIVFLYDREERFGILSMSGRYSIRRTLYYHGLITIAGIILGFLLNALLDFKVTNIFFYYLSIILIGNTFMSIIELLIVNFDDVGKFLALILLVLQLAAAGGTFPIQTVSKGFRWMHNLLPMTYSINLLKECLMTFEKNLFMKNFIVLLCLFIIFFTINILNDYRVSKKKIKKKKKVKKA